MPSNSWADVKLIRRNPLTYDPRPRRLQSGRVTISLPVPSYVSTTTRLFQGETVTPLQESTPSPASHPSSSPPAQPVGPLAPTTSRLAALFEELFGSSPNTTPKRVKVTPASARPSPDFLYIPVGVSTEAFTPAAPPRPVQIPSNFCRKLSFGPN